MVSAIFLYGNGFWKQTIEMAQISDAARRLKEDILIDLECTRETFISYSAAHFLMTSLYP